MFDSSGMKKRKCFMQLSMNAVLKFLTGQFAQSEI